MRKQLLAVFVGLVMVLVAAGQLAHANAGPGPNDIQDSLPVWNADGVHLAFERTAPNLQHIVRMTSAGKDTGVAALTGQLHGFVGDKLLIESKGETLVTRGGGTLHGTFATASPDGTRVAYVRGGALYSARPDATDERLLATGVTPSGTEVIGPAWSPDGTRIAVSSGRSMLIVQADGSGSRTIWHTDRHDNVNPSWSPDGTRIAWESNDGQDNRWDIWEWLEVGGPRAVVFGDSNYRFPQFSPVSGQLAYISDQKRLTGAATRFQYALYVRDENDVDHRLVDDVHPYSPPRWSPNGVLIAVSAGQECRRWGIYVVNASGGKARRRSNTCRVEGTTGDDRLTGSLYFDRIRGLGGSDVIIGRSGSDSIEGNNGDDTIFAGPGHDFVLAGPGDDVVYGGSGDDIVIGGNGHDRIDCGPGDDTVEGAGPLDRIARNCEHVRH